MSILVNAVEHGAISKAAHRRSESNVTATYDHTAQMNQHARNGGVRTVGQKTSVSIGNQRTAGGNGAGARPVARGLANQVKVKPRRGRAGAVLAGAGAVGAGVAAKRSMSKSAFDVEIGKALGDDNSIRGGVRSDYVPRPKTTGTPPGVLKARKALAPLKSAALAAAKK